MSFTKKILLGLFVGVAAGYFAALVIGAITGESLISTAAIADAPWFDVPNFVAPEFNLAAILFIVFDRYRLRFVVWFFFASWTRWSNAAQLHFGQQFFTGMYAV